MDCVHHIFCVVANCVKWAWVCFAISVEIQHLLSVVPFGMCQTNVFVRILASFIHLCYFSHVPSCGDFHPLAFYMMLHSTCCSANNQFCQVSKGVENELDFPYKNVKHTFDAYFAKKIECLSNNAYCDTSSK